MSSAAIPWVLPHADGAVNGTVAVPGSKSLMARELVLSAVADGPSRIVNALRSRDSLLMAAALGSLGHEVDTTDDCWSVTPSAHGGDTSIDCGLSGTVMRFVPPLAALTRSTVGFDGDPHARLRPMGPLLDGLRQAGVEVDDEGRGLLPFRVKGRGSVRGGAVAIDASGSSQFVSGLLLSAPRFDDGIRVQSTGAAPNRGHIRMTLQSLRARGVVTDELPDGSWSVSPGGATGREVTIEPDASNCAPFLCAAAATGGTVRLPGWPLGTAQPIRRLLEVLEMFGATTRFNEGEIVVTGGDRRAIDADLSDIGDMTPALAAMCLAADGPSRIRGVAYIRGHETDRLAALATELTKLGGEVSETEDGLTIVPHPLHRADLKAYADHRMVHAAAVAGLLVEGVTIDDIATTAKAMPTFAARWSELICDDATSAPEIPETAR